MTREDRLLPRLLEAVSYADEKGFTMTLGLGGVTVVGEDKWGKFLQTVSLSSVVTGWSNPLIVAMERSALGAGL